MGNRWIMKLTSTVLGAPEPRALAEFYAKLLGWPIKTDEPEWVTLRPDDGGAGLSFQLEAGHVPPVWPPADGAQQMQLHLDIEVDDLDAATAAAVEAGCRGCGLPAAGGRPRLLRSGRASVLPLDA